MPKNLFLPQTSLRHFDAYSMLRVPPPPEVAPRPEEFDVEMNKLCWSHFTPTTTIHEYFALLPGFRLSPVKIFPSLSLSPCSYEFECSQSAFRLFVSFDFFLSHSSLSIQFPANLAKNLRSYCHSVGLPQLW